MSQRHTNQETQYGHLRSWRKPRRHFPWAYIIIPALLTALALWAHLAGFGLVRLP